MRIGCWARLAACCAVLAAVPGAAEASVAWFTDVAPQAGAGHGEHNHGGPVERGRGGAVMKRLYMRWGADPVAAEYAHGPARPTTVRVLDPTGAVAEFPFGAEHHGQLVFPMPHEGFYNAYMTSARVDGETLRISVAKAEVLRHSCREGHDHVAASMPYRTLDGAAIEIVRERLADENFHTRIASGDRLSFRVLVGGAPAAGARVRMHTQEGWSKQVVADDQGRASFQIIRDYYPEWSAFEQRHQESFLVVAEHEAEQAGSHDGQPFARVRYVATLPGSYHPSARDYASYGYGLGAGLVGLTLTGGGILLHRRRRPRFPAGSWR